MAAFNYQDYLNSYKDLQDDLKDQSEYGLRQHYNKYGREENRTFKGADEYKASRAGQYDEKIFGIDRAVEQGRMTAAQAAELTNALNKDKYTPTADLSQFEGLLSKLEASKMKQAGSAALDTRRNTYAQGLAQMMSNF